MSKKRSELSKPPIHHIQGTIVPASYAFNAQGNLTFQLNIPVLKRPVNCTATPTTVFTNTTRRLAALAGNAIPVELGGHYIDGVFLTQVITEVGKKPANDTAGTPKAFA